MADENKNLTMGDLKKLITDTVTQVVGANTTQKEEKKDGGTEASGVAQKTEGPTASVGVAAMVKAEIDKLKARETEDAEKQTIQMKLTELSEKTAEKEPVERRRVHKFMGWGENEK